jgi:hypothetical protein
MILFFFTSYCSKWNHPIYTSLPEITVKVCQNVKTSKLLSTDSQRSSERGDHQRGTTSRPSLSDTVKESEDSTPDTTTLTEDNDLNTQT